MAAFHRPRWYVQASGVAARRRVVAEAAVCFGRHTPHRAMHSCRARAGSEQALEPAGGSHASSFQSGQARNDSENSGDLLGPTGGSNLGTDTPWANHGAEMERGGAATKRLAHELRALKKLDATKDEPITHLAPASDDDLIHWRAVLQPPPSGVYGGGRFELEIVVPDTYPIKPPAMRFRTRIFHPNVHWKVGRVTNLDRRNLPGCAPGAMEPSLDAAQCVYRGAGAVGWTGARQSAECGCGEFAAYRRCGSVPLAVPDVYTPACYGVAPL